MTQKHEKISLNKNFKKKNKMKCKKTKRELLLAVGIKEKVMRLLEPSL